MKLNLKNGQFSAYSDTIVLDTFENDDYRFLKSGELTTVQKTDYNFTDFLNTYYNLNKSGLLKKEECQHVFLGYTEKEMMDTSIQIEERGASWNKCIVIDLDFNKNLEFVEYKRDVFISFLQKSYINYKLSSSGQGIHFFLQFNDELTDLEISNLYLYFFKTISETLILLDINKVEYDDVNSKNENFYIIDTNMKNWRTQTLGLAYSSNYSLTSKMVLTYKNVEQTVEFQKIIFDREIEEQAKLTKKRNFGEIVNTDTLKKEVEQIVYKILDNQQITRIGGHNERIAVSNLFSWLGLKEEFLGLRTGMDIKKGVNFNSYYKTSISKNNFDVNFINYSLSLLNKAFNTKYYYFNNSTFLQKNELLLTCNKYITDNSENLPKILDCIDNNKKILINSKTGTGKTAMVSKLLPNFIKGSSGTFCCDTIALALQTHNNFIKDGFKSCLIQSTTQIPENVEYDVYVCVYDSLHRVPESARSVLFVDEYHSVIDNINFREKGIDTLLKHIDNFAGKVVYLTATPRFLNCLSNDFCRIDIESKFNLLKTNKYLLINKHEGVSRVSQMISVVLRESKKSDDKSVLMLNNKEDLKEIKEILTKHNIISEIVCSDTKNEDEYKNIVQNSLISENTQVVLCTKLLQNGINLLNLNIKNMLTEEVEETDLVQFISRNRAGNCNVYLFCNNNINYVNNMNYNFMLNKSEIDCNYYNSFNNFEVLKEDNKDYKSYLNKKGLRYCSDTYKLNVCKYKVLNSYKKSCEMEDYNNVSRVLGRLELEFEEYETGSDIVIQKDEEKEVKTDALLDKIKSDEELIKNTHLSLITPNLIEKEMLQECFTESEKSILDRKKVIEKIEKWNSLLEKGYKTENLTKLEKFDSLELKTISDFRDFKNGVILEKTITKKHVTELNFLYDTTLKFGNKINFKNNDYLDFVKSEFSKVKNKNGLGSMLHFIELNNVKDYLKLIFDLRKEHKKNGCTIIVEKDYTFLQKKNNEKFVSLNKYFTK